MTFAFKFVATSPEKALEILEHKVSAPPIVKTMIRGVIEGIGESVKGYMGEDTSYLLDVSAQGHLCSGTDIPDSSLVLSVSPRFPDRP